MAASRRLSLERRELPLDPPHSHAGAEWTERSILLLRVRDAHGLDGYGEASPLPGYSPDTADACEQALRAISDAELAALDELNAPCDLTLAAAALVPARLPAARFGLEAALLDRLGRRTRRPLWSLLGEVVGETRSPRPASTHLEEAPNAQLPIWPNFGQHEALVSAPVPTDGAAVGLCALLPTADPERALREAREHVCLGVRTFKLKVGPGRLLESQRVTLQALRGALGDSVRLRLDANRSLSRDALAATLAALASYEIEFLEEPLLDPEPAEFAASPCALALDESLQALDDATLALFLGVPTCRALVLKPTALGGLQRCIDLAGKARAHGREVVVSHTLEGPIGWSACAELALALAPSRAAGLWPLVHQRAAQPRICAGRLLRGEVPSQEGLA